MYEYVLDNDFFADQLKPSMPAIVFAIDISSSSISSGFFHQVINTIKQSLDYLVNGP